MTSPHLWKEVYYHDPKETLTGKVLGKDASDIEERFHLALMKVPDIEGVGFRVRLNPLLGMTEEIQNLPGELEVDFMAGHKGTLYMFSIKGGVHFLAAWQVEYDKEKEARINAAMASRPKTRPIISISQDFLVSQEQADRFVKTEFANNWPQQEYKI